MPVSDELGGWEEFGSDEVVLVSVIATGRRAGRRPRERRDASDAGRPAAYELIIFLRA